MMHATNLRSVRRRTLMICIGLAFVVNCGAGQPKYYADLTYPPLRDIPAQDVRRVTLANGIRLFLLEDHELPMVRMSVLIRVGSRHDPADKIGLASILGEVMRTGGTRSRSGEQVDVLLGQKAASLEVRVGFDSTHILASAMTGEEGTVLGVIADILMHPAFPDDRVRLAKAKRRYRIARRTDDPVSVGAREFGALVYGADSVYARQPQRQTIDRITREDLLAFHRRFIGSNGVMLGVWGDFDTAQMVGCVRQAFADWGPVVLEEMTKPQMPSCRQAAVCLVSTPDANQSTILMGHVGGMMSDPDYAALVVMNQILGSGFTGRLFRNVRSREGLAYAVFGKYACDFEYPGLFYVGCQTKSGTTGRAIRSMLKEITSLTISEVTEEELALAKDSYLNAFVFEFDAPEKVIRRLMAYEYHGYPVDFLERTRAAVEAVTRKDVLLAAQRHLRADQIQIVVLGCAEHFDEPLSNFGEVTPAPDRGGGNSSRRQGKPYKGSNGDRHE